MSLAMTYSHMRRPHTTIGAEQFHFRVREGIGWFPLAMVARQTGFAAALCAARGRVVCMAQFKSATSVAEILMRGSRTAWVLYGQASRAISTG